MTKCCQIKSGDLNKRITIQTLTETTDGQGGFSSSWVDGDSVWAKIKPLSSREREQGAKLELNTTHRIIVRFRQDLLTSSGKDRLKFGSRFFAIGGVFNIEEEDRFLEISAIEGGFANV
jgi:SPP1 family predicted phage head-tail adaptor